MDNSYDDFCKSQRSLNVAKLFDIFVVTLNCVYLRVYFFMHHTEFEIWILELLIPNVIWAILTIKQNNSICNVLE